mmetsp:Transcript_3452/g.9929  ORF Transcript_3452/g.9929 Transcript_3452/m.9929 type:complete len:305 (+) Transcript_3452:96-1010(+)
MPPVELPNTEEQLARVISAIFQAVADVSVALRSIGSEDADGAVNIFGDRQLKADVAADEIIFRKLRECGAVETASSEENTSMEPMGGTGYSVAFDPVDGSSIYPANWSVGTIFGIWPGAKLLGVTGREQAAAGFSVFGPRTLIVLARKTSGGVSTQEFTLLNGAWVVTREALTIPVSKKIFAPANMRAASENEEYQKLILQWMADKYTLRYSGGLVPDIYHIFAKGGGVFCNPVSKSAPAKLRLLYEVAPLAYVVEAAGGASNTGEGSALDMPIATADVRCSAVFGSSVEVANCLPAMKVGREE